tara:strand:+ start:332 stop:772 length:441 start_codon:yes stop_codon:yes gene_type:complete
MGLDMYLSAKRYLFSFNEHDKALADKIDAEVGASSLGHTNEIRKEAFYWRKAWAIHHWFVVNAQNGEDDCKEYWVERYKLKELLDTLKKVDKNPSLAEDILPLQSDDDEGKEWELEQVRRTIPALDKLINDESLKEKWDFYYSSSW